MPELHNARYECVSNEGRIALAHFENIGATRLVQGGGDPFMLTGEVFGHPAHNDGKTVHVSLPIWFDELEGRLITETGSNYRISSYYKNKNETVNKIKNDIKHKGYERY